VYSSEINTPEIIKYRRIFDEGFPELPESVIKSSGYVVDTLECVLWCVLNTDNYRDCVLKAVNFGNDTDTAACVAGALGGLLYGLEGIPVRWRETLVKSDYINTIISGFCRRNNIE
ncbi:MAG: ADP-ribosylglycohydrolase family protein, partial [Clostridia bacterium]|nr:ADP-ribosylglycohydrolase family protein [Clostridia bacterium]